MARKKKEYIIDMPGVSLNSKGETNYKLKSEHSGTIKITFFHFILLISATITNFFFYFHKALTRFLRTIGPDIQILTTKPTMVSNN